MTEDLPSCSIMVHMLFILTYLLLSIVHRPILQLGFCLNHPFSIFHGIDWARRGLKKEIIFFIVTM